MELKFDQILEKLTDLIKSEVKTETVIGSPFTLGEYTCVPIIKVGMGLGSGGGGGESEKMGTGTGAGGGAALGIQPIGFLVSRGSEITVLNVGRGSALSSMFDKVPDMLEKYMERKGKKEPVA